MLYLKGLAVWCLIASIEMIHGILRAKLLAPRVGDFRSRQITVFTGSILILLVTFLTFHWIGYSQPSETLIVGGIWLICMVAFEFSIGHYVFHFKWKWLINDFNLFKGRLLALGMLVLAFAPWICGRWKGLW
jgi:hypothetical protein